MALHDWQARRQRLKLVDEMGTHTSFAPLYAYAPRGKRAFFKVPRNRGKNTTLLASTDCEGMVPSMDVEGFTTKEVFKAYMEHFLSPTLREGQVVVIDNLGAHKGERSRELIEGKGCKHLPLTALLAGPQPCRGGLFEEQGAAPSSRITHPRGGGGGHRRALDAVTSRDARRLLGHCGYRLLPDQQL